MEDCAMWSMVGTKIYKKCAQVYKLEKRIIELEKAVKEWRDKADSELAINAKLHTETARLEAENKKLIEGQQAKINAGS